MFCFFNQNTAYEMRISDWSSDVCSSDLHNCAFVSIASPRRDPPMFSLQTIFGSGKQFFELLDESADAAYEAAKALHAMLKEADRQPALDALHVLLAHCARSALAEVRRELLHADGVLVWVNPIEGGRDSLRAECPSGGSRYRGRLRQSSSGSNP